MARISEERRKLEALLDEYGEKIKQAFIAAIKSIASTAVLAEVIRRLEAHDIDGAVAAIGIHRAHFSPVVSAIVEAHNAAGRLASKDVGGNIPFDPYGADIDQKVRDHGTQFVDRLVSDAQTVISTYFAANIIRGLQAHMLAIRVLGVLQRAQKERVGGILGLTEKQQEFASEAERELRSGEPRDIANYLKRKLREKRFDSAARAAAEANQPVPGGIVQRAVAGYAEKMTEYRGRMIGETGALTAVNMGREAGVRQAYQRAGIDPTTATKQWISRRDDRVRDTHIALDGQITLYDGFFISPSGARLRYPGDPQAPVNEIANCRCYLKYPRIGSSNAGKQPNGTAEFLERREWLRRGGYSAN